MEWINYHHLFYFWTVAKEGTIVKASEKLSLAQPTISGQIKRFEEVLGEKLFARKGRHLILTEVGQMLYGYAEEIFSLGREMQDVLKGRTITRQPSIVVGISNAFPRLIAHLLLAPTVKQLKPVTLVCREDKADRLLAELAIHKLDVVFTDAPMDPSIRVKAYNHLLGECGITIFGSEELAKSYRRDFPQALDGAPFLLPTDNTMIRQSLDAWFNSHEIRPQIVGEFEDSILLKVFGQSGMGLFPAPSAITDELRKRYGVHPVGTLSEVRIRYYAISVEKKLKHPALVAINKAARKKIFGTGN